MCCTCSNWLLFNKPCCPRCNHDHGCGSGSNKAVNMLPELDQKWWHASGNGRRGLGGRQVVGDTGQDHNVGTGTNWAKGIRENFEARGSEHLSIRKSGTISDVERCHVLTNVRVPDNGKDTWDGLVGWKAGSRNETGNRKSTSSRTTRFDWIKGS